MYSLIWKLIIYRIQLVNRQPYVTFFRNTIVLEFSLKSLYKLWYTSLSQWYCPKSYMTMKVTARVVHWKQSCGKTFVKEENNIIDQT